MKLEDIQAEWDIDSQIDRTQLGNEAIKIPSLQSKYYKWYIREALQLKALEEQFNILKLEKWEFYWQGPTQEQINKGWKLPPKGEILKSEVNQYLDADQDLIAEKLRIAKQREKVKFLEHIIDGLKQRSWNLRSAIDFEKFRAGG